MRACVRAQQCVMLHQSSTTELVLAVPVPVLVVLRAAGSLAVVYTARPTSVVANAKMYSHSNWILNTSVPYIKV